MEAEPSAASPQLRVERLLLEVRAGPGSLLRAVALQGLQAQPAAAQAL
jgi:hypothetical protein